MGSRSLGVVLVCVSTLVALAAGEIGLRAVNEYRPPDDPIRTEQGAVYRADPDVGYTLWPSRTTTHRYPETSPQTIELVSNSDGFRNARELDEHDGRMRVLVVGDSFVFGLGVRADERLTERLEALEPGWRVDNVSMTGWGLDLMIRAIERHGRKADPDVVVLVVYVDDFRRLHPYYAGLGFPFQKFALMGSELVSVPYPYPKPWERLRLVQMAYHIRGRRDHSFYALNGALLERFLQLGRTVGFQPVVVFAPGTMDSDADRERRTFVTSWAAARGVPYMDLTTPLLDAGVDKVFIRDNWHWNALGHRIAAVQLHKLLRQHMHADVPAS